jgi:twitching motility protein PilT
MTLENFLEKVVSTNSSDLHIISGYPPIIRRESVLSPIPGEEVLTPTKTKEMVFTILTVEQRDLLTVNKEVDFSYSLGGKARFRVNAYNQRGSIAAAFRYIPAKIRTVEELNLPKVCHTFAELRQGFILVTGPTGHGKSTTLAAIIDEINKLKACHIVTIEDPIEYVYSPAKIRTVEELNLPKVCHTFAELRQGFILVTGPTGHGKSTTLAAIIDEINKLKACHIVTIEDPIEYVYSPAKSIVSQRELHGDTHSWDIALRSVLREDPDVVLVGEMRDYETIRSALTIAETGHLVFATLHTNSAAQTVDRIVDVFPEHQQSQIRMQLSLTLEAVFSQRLIPSLKGGMVPAAEILVATPAVKTTIREGKTHLINNIIQTSAEVGMLTLEMSLADLIRRGWVSFELAREYSLRPEELTRLVKGRK